MYLEAGKRARGIVASGHRETSTAAARVLQGGGNAFDAVLAGLCAATVAEPMLVSLGGGGFLIARPADAPSRVYDFFCNTPGTRRHSSDLDFYPFAADFGGVEQEFHIGMGSMAVPGVVAGLFAAHEDLGRIPLREVVLPAVELAKGGVQVNEFQAEVIQVLQPIYQASPHALELYSVPGEPGRLLTAGQRQCFPGLADSLESLAREGRDLFYHGDFSKRVVADCREKGGQLSSEDFSTYDVERRRPVRFGFRGAQMDSNPPPSIGGGLIAFALGLMDHESAGLRNADWGSFEHLISVVRAMRGAAALRETTQDEDGFSDGLLERILRPETLAHWRSLPNEQLFSRGTTHISVVDSEGNLASLTASNGEGCGYLIPDTDIMMNNMLGEEDLNPRGFHRWKPGTRLASMMSPTLAQLADGRRLALGSGGSNRIRSAITQVLVNVVDFELPLLEAVAAPRVHLEKGKLSVEDEISEAVLKKLGEIVEELEPWGRRNLFFGGVHVVGISPDGRLQGCGDPRRAGFVAAA